MRDIPIFTTEYGAASLVLSQIPYRENAYVIVQSASEPERLLKECRDFCRAAGAKRIYARGMGIGEKYPVYTTLIRMERPASGLISTATLRPVTDANRETWRQCYNARMKDVPLAAYMTEEKCRSTDGYFVEKDGAVIGLGAVSGNRIDAVIAVQKGSGREVLAALCSRGEGNTLCLEVADTNRPAMRLYTAFGFQKTAELERWFEI